MKYIIFTFILIICFSSILLAQTDDKVFTIPADNSACEGNPTGFAMVRQLAKERNEKIFMIFRAGKGETETVNSRRLEYVKKFYFQRWAEFYKLNVIYARGEKTDGEGRIEFYVGGELVFITLCPKNKTPCLDCCSGLDEYGSKNLLRNKPRKRKN